MRALCWLMLGLVISLLPHRWKQHRFLSGRSPANLHVVTGFGEAVAAGALWCAGLIPFIRSQTTDVGAAFMGQMLESGGSARMALHGMGAFAFVAYLLQPVSLALTFLGIEGVVRGLDALANQGTPGASIFVAVDRVQLWLRASWTRFLIVRRFGPVRPDELIVAMNQLTLLTSRRKQWHDAQVVRHDGQHYQLRRLDEVNHGLFDAYHYRFARLPSNEIIRGEVFDLDTSVADDARLQTVGATRTRLLDRGHTLASRWMRHTITAVRQWLELGPLRPDEFIASPDRLTLLTPSRKPWTDHQVVRHRGRLYRLAVMDEVCDQRLGSYRYCFAPLPANEIIRGAVVVLED